MRGGTTTGEGNFSYGSNASILATPLAGIHFRDGRVTASRILSLPQQQSVWSKIEKYLPGSCLFTISLSVNSSIGGIANGEGNFSHGSNASITATPATGYSFTGLDR